MIKSIKDKIYGKLESLVGADTFEFFLHSKNYVTASFFTKALAFMSLPILTRLLTPSDYGVISVFSSITSILFLFMGLGVIGSIFRYFFEKTTDFGGFLCTNLFFLGAFNLLFMLCLYYFRDYISTFINLDPILLLIAAAVAFFTLPFDIYKTYLRALKNSRKLLKISVIKSLFVLSISIIWIWSLHQNRYLGKIYTVLLFAAIFFIYAIYKLVNCLNKLSFKLQHLKYSLKYGLPIVPHVLAGTILVSFDTIQINQLTTSAYAGLYGFAYTVGMILYVVIMGTNQAWGPMFFDYMNKKEYGLILKLSKRYVKIIALVALSLVLFSKEIVIIIAAKQFHAGLELVPIIILAYFFVFLYTFYGRFTYYDKKTYMLPIFTGIAAVFNIASNYMLIPIYGYKIAAVTTMLSYMLLFILHYLNTSYILKRKIISLKVLAPETIMLFILSGIYIIFFGNINSYMAVFSLKCIMLLCSIVFVLRDRLKDRIFKFRWLKGDQL